MEDLEEDPEMRSKVNLYRKDGKSSSLSKGQKSGSGKKEKIQSDKEKKKGETENEDDDVPQVPNEELIDDLTEAMETMSTGKSSDLLNIGPEEGDDEPITF